jgi:hypothetical protein
MIVSLYNQTIESQYSYKYFFSHLVLGLIAVFLVRKNLSLLSARSASKESREIIFGVLSKNPLVEKVDSMKAVSSLFIFHFNSTSV